MSLSDPLRTDLHPEAAALFDEVEREGKPTTYQLSVESARTRLDEKIDELRKQGIEQPYDGQIREFSIPGPETGVPIKVYEPDLTDQLPVLVWIHGGGWVRGDTSLSDSVCRFLSRTANVTVVSVDYRLAPEHPFPAGLLDSYAVLEWVSENDSTIHGDGDRIVVGGASAGGNLAAALTLMARDRDGPTITHQLLSVPVTDYRFDTESYDVNASGYGLHTEDMRYYWEKYLERDLDGAHPYASPLRARSLANLPSATVFTAGYDPLRDDGLQYAKRLEAAGVNVTRLHYPSMPHNVASAMYLDAEIGPAPEAFQRLADEVIEHTHGQT